MMFIVYDILARIMGAPMHDLNDLCFGTIVKRSKKYQTVRLYSPHITHLEKRENKIGSCKNKQIL